MKSRPTRWAAILLLLVATHTAFACAATCNANPRLASSFIEGYYPADWTAAQWDTLYTNQKNACIQSQYDSTKEDVVNVDLASPWGPPEP